MTATVVSVLVHTPPGVASKSVIVELSHTTVGPEISAGNGLTVMVVIAAHVVGSVYSITVVHGPGPMPVTSPVNGSIAAQPGLLLLHVPPGVRLVKVMVESSQTDEGPPIVSGWGFTRNTVSVLQPVPESVKVIRTSPGVRPAMLTESPPIGVRPTVPPKVDHDHVPGPGGALNIFVDPSHTR